MLQFKWTVFFKCNFCTSQTPAILLGVKTLFKRNYLKCNHSLWRHLSSTNLNDDVSLSGAAAVQLAVLLDHHNLPLLLDLVRVLLHMVEDAPVVLLGDADELVEDDMGTAGELVVEQKIALHHIWILKQQQRGRMRMSKVRHGRDEQTEEGNVQRR